MCRCPRIPTTSWRTPSDASHASRPTCTLTKSCGGQASSTSSSESMSTRKWSDNSGPNDPSPRTSRQLAQVGQPQLLVLALVPSRLVGPDHPMTEILLGAHHLPPRRRQPTDQ